MSLGTGQPQPWKEGANRAIATKAVIAQGAKSLGGDRGPVPLQRHRSHQVEVVGIEPTGRAGKCCTGDLLPPGSQKGPLPSSATVLFLALISIAKLLYDARAILL
jgi:hypothetical protein